MYIIEMVDDWDRTVQTWTINRSEEEVYDFVEKLNSGLSKELRRKVKSNNDYYFYYRKCEVNDFPSENELMELMKPSEFELEMTNSTYDIGLLEGIKDWNVTNVTDFTNLFK